MKVFLSWSGHTSHQVALVLRDWLPSVIQSIKPYVSSEDIDKGARWSTDIAKELEDSTFGLLCVTKENLEAPWLLFEAGALSKMMEKSAVCPFIFDLKRAEIRGPILQFQSTIFEKEDVKKLILSLNKACGEVSLKEDLLLKAFDVWWPKLESDLKTIDIEVLEAASDVPKKDLREEMLEEILELSRTNQKILRSPDILLPPDYLEYFFKERFREDDRESYEELRRLGKELEFMLMRMREHCEMSKEKSTFDEEVYVHLMRIMDLFKHYRMLIESSKRRRFK